MKLFKKTLSVLLIVILALAAAAPALAAADDYSVTIANAKEGHTYEAYQIFKGELSEEKILSDIGWGTGVKGSELLAALKQADSEKYGDCESAADVAYALGGKDGFPSAADAEAFAAEAAKHTANTSGTLSGPSQGKYTISGLSAGYYLVKDKDGSLAGKDDAYTKYIVKVAGNVEMEPKDGTVTSQKKVKDINDSEASTYSQWQDTADYDIGDRVPFQLKAVLPEDYDEYGSYELNFHDTESEGLTFQKESVKVYLDGELVNSGDYSIVTEELAEGYTFEIRFADLKKIAAENETKAHNGSVITAEYESVLNESAKTGSQGNPNDMHITFSNNPNGEGMGKTLDDRVIVFTYKVVVNKVDGESKPLEGAQFTLEKKNYEGVYEAVDRVEMTSGSVFSFNGLDDGDYRLTETVTPEGYNTIKPIDFSIAAVHDDATLSLKSLSGNTASGDVTEIIFASAAGEGSLTTDIVNVKGATLPETGGMGTTIFYALGGALVIIAGIMIVVKLRVKEDHKE